MNRLTRLSVALVFAACTTSWQASAGPIIDGREWYQPVELVGYSWNDFNAVCGAGACSGLLGGSGPNLSGWIWASIYELGDLLAATSPHPGGIATYQTSQLQPWIDWRTDTGFLPTTDIFLAINLGITAVAGLTSTLAPGDASAYVGIAQASIFASRSDFGSTFTSDVTAEITEAGPYFGAWLYRAAEVPAPATLWLVALGVAALRWSRYRGA
jgi:hypothetical protein